MSGGAGVDTIRTWGTYGTINGGTGNDSIVLYDNSRNNLIIYNSGDGYDTITGFNSDDTISIGGNTQYSTLMSNGNTVVSLNGGSMTLTDTSSVDIKGGRYVSPIPEGETISNTTSNTLISTGAGNDSVYNHTDSAVTINTGAGNDTIYDAFSQNGYFNAGDGDNYIYSNHNWATVVTGSGNDTITGNHWRTNIDSGDGNDLISLTTYWYNTISGGNGNDSIISGGGELSVNGGEGADYISLSGSNLTVTGGKGNDIIYGDSTQSHVYQYVKGDGNDTIYGFGANDVLQITGAKFKKSTIKGTNDVKVSVTGGANIILAGAASLGLKNININGEQAADSTPQEVILKFMKALDDTENIGEAAMDDAVKACSNYTSMQSLVDKLYREVKFYVEQDPENGVNNFLLEKCDINLYNNDIDVGAITGSDAGGDTSKNASEIVPEPKLRDKNFSDDSFSTNGVTFKIGDEKTFDDLNKDQQFIWQSIYSNWAKQGLNLIEESYGYSFADDEFKADTIYIYFSHQNNGTLAWTSTPYYYIATQRSAVLNIGVNTYYYNNFADSDLDGLKSGNADYLDRAFTHEMVHAIMGAKVKAWRSLSISLIEGTAELVKGMDDTRTNSIKYLINNPDDLKFYLNVNETNYQDNTDRMYAAGYILLRYLAKQASSGNDTDILGNRIDAGEYPTGVSIKSGVLSLAKTFKPLSIDLVNYPATITKLDASKVTHEINIMGSNRNDSIKGSSKADKIYGSTRQ